MNEVLSHYREIMTDPAHMMAEVSLMLIVDVLLLGIIWPLIIRPLVKRVVRKEHLTIDAEHGVVNHGAPTRRLGVEERSTV